MRAKSSDRPAGAFPIAGASDQRTGRGRRRRTVDARDIQIVDTLSPNQSHPLAELSVDQRRRSRVAALGSVLAAIARRQNENGESTVVPGKGKG